MMTHKVGELFAFSSGEYSDCRFNGLYRALKDLDLAELARQYYEQCPPSTWNQGKNDADGAGWGAWLIAGGYAEDIPYDEIHCGSYEFEVDQIAADLHARSNANSAPCRGGKRNSPAVTAGCQTWDSALDQAVGELTRR